jgi:hypothetical protein
MPTGKKGAVYGAEMLKKGAVYGAVQFALGRSTAHQFALKGDCDTGFFIPSSTPQAPKTLGFAATICVDLQQIASNFIELHQWPRRDSNPHERLSPRDFKSRASAIPPLGLPMPVGCVGPDISLVMLRRQGDRHIFRPTRFFAALRMTYLVGP